MINEKIRLNKAIKQLLLLTLMKNDVSVKLAGKPNLYIIVVKNKKGIFFEYKHNEDIDTIMVGKEIVAQDYANTLPEDMQDIFNILSNKIAEQRELEQLENDRQNIKDFEFRALTRLQQLNNR